MRSLDHHAAFRHLYFLAVYFKFNHDGQSSLTCYRSIVRPVQRPFQAMNPADDVFWCAIWLT
jgi:hypothetical protein